MAGNLIYSLGTSNRSFEEFIDILRHYDIKVLVDIRRFPTSKFLHFKRENLERLVKEKDIDYVYLGGELGGYRPLGYENYMKTQEFKYGLSKLRNLAEKTRVCIFCSERLAFKCHRRFVGSALKELGYKVIHIIDKEKTWIPKY